MQAAIDENGAVLLGRGFACDAHAGRPVRLVTHAHSDHLYNLGASLRECRAVLATPLTRDIIGILQGQRQARKIQALPYGQVFELEGERLTLFSAHHIVGSAQALLETPEGKRIVYTGDIKTPPAEILPADVLVIEATYGNPDYVRRFQDTVAASFAELVSDSLKKGPVTIFGYHGKLQEAVQMLNQAAIEAPILAPEKIYEILKICRAHGLGHTNFFRDESPEGRQIRQGRHIELHHLAARSFRGDGMVKVILSGWQFDAACKRIAPDTWQVALSDHCDFEQLLEYVRGSRPELVITDGYRCGEAHTFAGEVSRRLGIQATAMP